MKIIHNARPRIKPCALAPAAWRYRWQSFAPHRARARLCRMYAERGCKRQSRRDWDHRALSSWCNKGSLAPFVSVDARKQETPSPTTDHSATLDLLKLYRMIPTAVCFFGKADEPLRCLTSHEFQSSVRYPQAEIT